MDVKSLLKRRRRAEGLSEYTILLTIVMVCSVVGLISASSRAMRQIASDKNLCRIEGKDCDGVEDSVISAEDMGLEDEDEAAEGEAEDGESPVVGEGEAAIPDEAEDMPTNTQLGPVAEAPSAWAQWWGPLSTNPMVQGFAGLMGWFI